MEDSETPEEKYYKYCVAELEKFNRCNWFAYGETNPWIVKLYKGIRKRLKRLFT